MTLAVSRESRMSKGRVRMQASIKWGFYLFAATAACVCFPALAVDTQRFQLSGSGTLQLDPSVQKSGNMQLNARLTTQENGRGAPSAAQSGVAFALKASLSAASMVCYNDTIFRDDFDGNGL